MDHETLQHFSIVSTSDQTDYKKYPYIAGNILSAALLEPAPVAYWKKTFTARLALAELLFYGSGRTDAAAEVFATVERSALPKARVRSFFGLAKSMSPSSYSTISPLSMNMM